MASSDSETRYFLGFDGGGTKTECVLVDAAGNVLARSFAGASNPLRAGYTRAWFALSEAGDVVLRRQGIRAQDVSGVCAGLGGAGRQAVVNRATTFFDRSFPNAAVRVTTDLEVGLEAAFGLSGEGILLLAGTGSAAFGRDASGRVARAGGHGPWFSDEGSAFDIGRAAVRAVSLFEERRGPATTLANKIFSWNDSGNWDVLLDHIAKNADDVFPKMFPLVALAADKGDAVACDILAAAAGSLAGLARAVAIDLGWLEREISVAKLGGIYGRSKYFDAQIDAALAKSLPRARAVRVETAPADAAARMARRLPAAKGTTA